MALISHYSLCQREHMHESCLVPVKVEKREKKTGRILGYGGAMQLPKILSLLGLSGTTAQLGEIIWDCHVVMQRVNGKI